MKGVLEEQKGILVELKIEFGAKDFEFLRQQR